jgi:hypothetical protein
MAPPGRAAGPQPCCICSMQSERHRHSAQVLAVMVAGMVDTSWFRDRSSDCRRSRVSSAPGSAPLKKFLDSCRELQETYRPPQTRATVKHARRISVPRGYYVGHSRQIPEHRQHAWQGTRQAVDAKVELQQVAQRAQEGRERATQSVVPHSQGSGQSTIRTAVFKSRLAIEAPHPHIPSLAPPAGHSLPLNKNRRHKGCHDVRERSIAADCRGDRCEVVRRGIHIHKVG